MVNNPRRFGRPPLRTWAQGASGPTHACRSAWPMVQHMLAAVHLLAQAGSVGVLVAQVGVAPSQDVLGHQPALVLA